MASFGWLHFTDLHQGLEAQGSLWPNVREILFADLSKLHERCGPWDLVLFSGDLTQRGSAEEFAGLNAILKQLWDHLRSLGSTPALLAVPGNHDLVRPPTSRPESLVLARWATYPEVQVEFWRDPNSPYRKLVDEAFTNYTAWSADHPLVSAQRKHGMVPGDFSAVIQKDSLRIGVVGLNSTFLQISGGNYEGKLAIDVRQFHAACDGDGPAWVKGCDFALIMTHHPPDWLSPEARDHFFSEIAPPGRFAAHVFGHMHEHMATTLSIGGSAPRRQIQGSSLFGLETFGDGKLDRRHGYSAGRITVDDCGEANLRLWPRIAKKHAAGHQRIVQDLDMFELGDDQGTRPEPISLKRKATPSTPPDASSAAAEHAWTDWWMNTDTQGRPITVVDDDGHARVLKAWGPPIRLSDKCALLPQNAALMHRLRGDHAKRLREHPWDHVTSALYRHEHGDQPRIVVFHTDGIPPDLLTYGKICELTKAEIEAENNGHIRRFIIEERLVRIQSIAEPTLAQKRYSSDLLASGVGGTVNLGITGTIPGELDIRTGAWRDLTAEEAVSKAVAGNRRASEFGLEVPLLERGGRDLFDQLKTAEGLVAFTYSEVSSIYGCDLTALEVRLFARHCVAVGIFAAYAEYNDLFIGTPPGYIVSPSLQDNPPSPYVALSVTDAKNSENFSWILTMHNLSPNPVRLEGASIIWRFRHNGTASRLGLNLRAAVMAGGDSRDFELSLPLATVQESATRLGSPIPSIQAHALIYAVIQIDLKLAVPSASLFHVFRALPAGPDPLWEQRRFLCSSDQAVLQREIRTPRQAPTMATVPNTPIAPARARGPATIRGPGRPIQGANINTGEPSGLGPPASASTRVNIDPPAKQQTMKAKSTAHLNADELLLRYEQGERDFTGISLEDDAKLEGASLQDICLHRALLSGARFGQANLQRADLRNANLQGAWFGNANLRDADLRGTVLDEFNGVASDCNGCKISVGDRWLGRWDIQKILAWHHMGAIVTGIETLPPDEQRFFRTPGTQTITPNSDLQSTFISYGHPDTAFAEALNTALLEKGVKTFFFKNDAIPGQKLHRMMREGVNDHDRVILICSKASLDRPGVLNEIQETLQRESRDGGKEYLIPIRLDDYVFVKWTPGDKGTAQAIRDRVVADFRGADKDPVKFQAGLSQLLTALKK